MRALYKAIIAVTVLTVAASGQAIAGGKGGGGGGHVSGDVPKGNVSLNYRKFNNTYTPQRPEGSLRAKNAGKAKFNEFTIKKTIDKASP